MGKIFFKIDEKRGIVNTTCTGKISLDDLREHTLAVVYDPKFRKGMNTITDIREADFNYSFFTSKSFRDYIRDYEESRGEFKWAIIIDMQKNHSPVQLFHDLAKDGLFSIKLFENRDDAEKWICSKTPEEQQC